jgi:hypothetical protein
MIGFVGRIFQAGFDVIRFQIGVIFEDLRSLNLGGEEVKHVLNPDPHSPDAGKAHALDGIEGDSLVHDSMIN